MSKSELRERDGMGLMRRMRPMGTISGQEWDGEDSDCWLAWGNMDSVRLLLAGVTTLVALMLVSTFWSKVLPQNTPPFLLVVVFAVSLIPVVIGVLIVFNLGRKRR